MHQASVYHVYTRVSFLVHSNNNAYIHERMNVCTSAGHLPNFSFSFLPLFCYRILSLIAVTRRSFSSSPPFSRSFTIGRRTRLHEHFRNFPPWIFVPVARSLLPRAKHAFIHAGSTTRGNCPSLFMQISRLFVQISSSLRAKFASI